MGIAFAVPATTNAALVYSDEASFLAALTPLAPGYYLEDFTGVPAGGPWGPLSFTGGAPTVSYDASALNGLWGVSPFGDPALSVNTSSDPIVLDFSASPNPVLGVGGVFFATDFNGDLVDGTVTVALSDGTSVSYFVPASVPLPFSGFIATGGTYITQLSLSVGPVGEWATMDHVYAAAVPEPHQFALLAGLGLVGFAAYRRGRRS